MTKMQNCWHCNVPYPVEDLRVPYDANEKFYGAICVKCRVKEYLRHEIRNAKNTIRATESVTEALQGWTDFKSWANHYGYQFQNGFSKEQSNLKVYMRSECRSYAVIWFDTLRWYGGIVQLSQDGKTLVPVSQKWCLGAYLHPVSAAVHAIFCLGKV